MHSIPVLLLAGGKGTRISSVYRDIPKCMIPVGDKPFIDYALENIRAYGFRDVIILAGYLADPIMQWVGDGARYGLAVTYQLDGDVLLGTGGAIKKALRMVKDDFAVSYADSYLDYDWSHVVKAYYQRHSSSMMTVYKNTDATDKSNILFREGKIIAYSKTNQTDEFQYIDWGMSIFSKESFAGFPDGQWDLSSYVQGRIAAGKLDGYVVPTRYWEIGTPEALEKFRLHMAHRGAI